MGAVASCAITERVRSNHILTIDVEEYFQVVNLEGVFDRASWDRVPSRLEIGLEKLARLLERHGARATCFVLGCVAARRPELVRGLAAAGCEIASHGFDHRRLSELDPEAFDRDLARAEEAIGEACGERVRGYRAPHFSIDRRSLWAFDVLVARGYRYDSSVFASFHPEYGLPTAPAQPFILETSAGSLLELPVAVASFAGARLPVGGGGWLRHTPYALTRAALRRLERRGGAPFTIYLHPWELDADQPRVGLPAWRRWRQYHGLGTTEGKVARLLSDFRFGPASEALDQLAWPRISLARLGGEETLTAGDPDSRGKGSRTLRAPAPGA